MGVVQAWLATGARSTGVLIPPPPLSGCGNGADGALCSWKRVEGRRCRDPACLQLQR